MDVQGARAATAATRLAIVLAGLVLSHLAPSTASAARSEFFGTVQIATLNEQDIEGMAAARVRTNRFVLKWGWVQPTQGSFEWGPADRFIGRLAVRGIRAVPAVWGNPGWVAGSGSTPPIGGPVAEQAWRNFLKALVARYGPAGSYWATDYRQQYGAGATALPIQSWQVWNEPNLQKYFAPTPSPGKYARLLQISHNAINSQDPKARIVLAGVSGNGDLSAWDFIKSVYSVAGIKYYFDAVALHPYASTLDRQRQVIQKVRAVMRDRADGATPLWITELAWGSAAPDRFGINKGLAGQAQMLSRSFRMILNNRTAWNVQRLFWLLWRDPSSSQAGTCSFCASAGLLRYDRTPKPAYTAFRGFTAETNPPQARITGGPAQGSFIKDPTPSFALAAGGPTDAGSTFVCRVDGRLFKTCTSPYTTPLLSDGSHVFFVRAIDAPGNESQIVWRSFTVDTHAPPAPRITDTDPNSPANDNAPEVKGSAAAGTTVKLHRTAGCTNGTAVAQGSAAKFASPGITATVADNTTTAFRARAIDAAGNLSACSGSFSYVEDSTP
ncbi:MAG: glycosyl hydrolase [Actinomycetota bacterium]